MKSLRIIKVGGSLLDLPDLKQRIYQFLSDIPEHNNIFIAGGGKLVDQVRLWQDRHQFSDKFAHWLCIDLMSINSRFLAKLLFDGPPLSNVETIPTDSFVFDPAVLLRTELHLDECWEITSDSIAAAVCRHWNVNELILLKSTNAKCRDIASWCEAGLVDYRFAEFATGIDSIRVVNLRGKQPSHVDHAKLA